MAIFKKVMKNLFIFLGVILGIFLILLAVMYFSGAKIFGLKVRKPAKLVSERLDKASYQTITINAGNTNITVNSAEESKKEFLEFDFKDDATGLCAAKNSTLSYTISGENTEDLVITVNEPKGMIFWKNTWLTLKVSDAILLNDNFKLIINTTDSAEVLIKATKNISNVPQQIENITFNAEKKGSFTSYDKIDNLVIKANKTKINLKKDVENLTLTMGSGNMEFTNITNLVAKDCKNPYLKGKVVFDKFEYAGESGKIIISKIGEKNLNSEDDPQMDFLQEYTGVYIYDYAKVNIKATTAIFKLKEVIANANIETTKGKIEIDTLIVGGTDNLIKTTSGKVEIENALANKLTVATTKGNIELGACGESGEIVLNSIKGKITFEANAEILKGKNRNASSETYYDVYNSKDFLGKLTISNEKGKTVAKELKTAVNISSVKGRIEAEFLEVKGASSITSQKGTVVLELVQKGDYEVLTQAVKKSVKVKMDSLNLDYKDKTHAPKKFSVGNGSAENTISVKTTDGTWFNGNIKIKGIK